jgi:PIN domain nuclease of toxin-antitoxin system
MDTLREVVETYGACATRAMLDEVIKQEQKNLEERMKDINLYMSGQVEVGVISAVETKISSIEEQLAAKQPSAKAEQRAKEAAKRAELTAAGTNPHEKLTKENLEKWLKEGKSYSQIARDEVGLRQEEVSAAAKKYNLKPKKAQQTLLVTKETAE